MKKLLAIVAIFCFATIITNAEPIQDKEFEAWIKKCFKNEQSLKINLSESVLNEIEKDIKPIIK